MDDLFHLLSASARIDKGKKKRPQQDIENNASRDPVEEQHEDANDLPPPSLHDELRKDSDKERQIHQEQTAAFRNALHIRIANKHDPDLADPMVSFNDMNCPDWFSNQSLFRGTKIALLRNTEASKWKEPTAIQMQAIPCLLAKRDVIGSAPTGSGKSAAFLIPAIVISSAEHSYTSDQKQQKGDYGKMIRSLVLAPTLELAAQLHRETERLGFGKPGGIKSILLSKSNAGYIIAGDFGKSGVDVLVATPLRLVDCIKKGLKLNHLRMIVLDEADRLLDATDHKDSTFLSQMDAILSEIPITTVRSLFSATVNSRVRELAERILRNPVDITVGSASSANPDIEQKLVFVGREEGKLLAIRQLVQRGELRPPVIVFLQSQERAQALFGELLYDGIHVDVIHAQRSKAARENAVAKFRRGDTWVLITTDLVARGVDFRAVNMVINYDLPDSGVNYIHRIGRTGRAGRKGTAITLFTEADFDNLRTIANIMKQSGCGVPEWMLNLKKKKHRVHTQRSRQTIDTTPSYDKRKRHKKQQMIQQSKQAKGKVDQQGTQQQK
jgi:ATP-dependent RNA helicase DDX52/ROK1